MNKILKGAFLITAIAIALTGGTVAFFGDTERSSGNVFAAGLLDLKVDNESYYNGNVCAPDVDDINKNGNIAEFVWQGTADYPVAGEPCVTSFPQVDLDDGFLFFDFRDVKPDDEGEDTISLHVQNDAWMCMDLALTSNDDNSSTEPELGVGDSPDIADNVWDGELAQHLEFFWWADDGDNVYEEDERPLTNGVQTLLDMTQQGSSSFSVALADAENNVWKGTGGIPVPANETVYIAKAWCVGTLTLSPLEQDGGDKGRAPNGPEGPGVVCDGTALGNVLQTDGLTLNVAFRAVQARHNERFLCQEKKQRLAKITVVKEVINDDGGNNPIESFLLFVGSIPVTSGVSIIVPVGTYEVNELGAQGYEATFTGDCDGDGTITLNEGDDKTCTITNNDIRPLVTLIKNVVGGTALPQDFKMRLNGTVVPIGSSRSVNANTNVTITEDPFPGYVFTSITGAGCPSALGQVFQLDEGVSLVCTITNTRIP